MYSVAGRCNGRARRGLAEKSSGEATQGEAKISNGIVQYRMVGLCKGMAKSRTDRHSAAWHSRGMELRGDARVREGKAVQIEVRSGNENVKECHAV